MWRHSQNQFVTPSQAPALQISANVFTAFEYYHKWLILNLMKQWHIL
jgi:hypothetical protein